ncbi:hypothetical protein V1515DRAFT_126548 [Lipomyces mesembrius]
MVVHSISRQVHSLSRIYLLFIFVIVPAFNISSTSPLRGRNLESTIAMPWRMLLQKYLTQKLLESESFHQVVRAIHRNVNDVPSFTQNLKANTTQNDKVSKALKLGHILLDEIKQAARGKLPKS